MRILVTGFEPFGGETINPSAETVSRLPDRLTPRDGSDTLTLHRAILPVSFGHSLARLTPLIAEIRPDIILALGEAGGRPDLSLERVAINLQDAGIPDNDGAQPIDRPVVAGGPDAYFSTLPVKPIMNLLRERGLPASLSHTAGTFVCNHLFYHLCRLAATTHPGLKTGFLHLPYLPQQAARHKGAPSMSLDLMIEGVTLALLTTAMIERHPLDAAIP